MPAPSPSPFAKQERPIRFIAPKLPAPADWVPFLEPSYREQVFSNGGPAWRLFKKRMSQAFQIGDREALPVASGTAGLVAALQALNLSGEVVCPAFTFSATAHAIRLAGLRPLLCDVDPDTWELSPSTLLPALARRPAAILHVRAFGFCRDLAGIEALAKEAKIPLVIDAAAALGGRLHDGRRVGGQGDCEVFSLHATKPFAIGEGGLVMAHPDLLQSILCRSNFSLSYGAITGPGANGKMSDVQAAVGLAVLERFADELASRRAHIAYYLKALEASEHFTLPRELGAFPGQTMPLRCKHRSSAEWVERAARLGIESRSYYAPSLGESAAFSECPRASDLAVSRTLSRSVLCLPNHTHLEAQDLCRIRTLLTARQRPRRRARHALVGGPGLGQAGGEPEPQRPT